MNLLTVDGGTVHAPTCQIAQRAATWPWQPRNDGPGVAHACAKCLPGGLPEEDAPAWSVGAVAQTAEGDVVLRMTEDQAAKLRDTLNWLTSEEDE